MSLLVTMSMILVFVAIFLMLAKAFDRVNHSILFDRLLQHDLSPVVTRALLNWYSDQNVCVSWNGQFSNKFSVSNGVRQGGVLSPILFTVYIDDLLTELEKKKVLVVTGTIILWVLFATLMTLLSLHHLLLLFAFASSRIECK